MKHYANHLMATLAKRLLPFCLFLFVPVSSDAQTFMEHLQQHRANEGTIVVTQSKDIDILVNAPSTAVTTKATNTKNKSKENKKAATSNNKKDSSSDVTTVDNSKKLPANATKVDGYRVQVFYGGNSRQDKQKAQQTGADVKAHFPDQPVYVHFNAPHWICRVGNFRNNEDATRLLNELREMGYTGASIIKGKITVQY